MRFREQGPLLVDLENAERNSGNDVIAVRDAPALQLIWQSGRVAIDHVNARVIGKLPPEIPGKCRIQLE